MVAAKGTPGAAPDLAASLTYNRLAVKIEALLPFRRPSSDVRVRLVCLPFAGGSAATYRGWREKLPADVDLCAVELAGRAGRFRETPVDDPDAVVTELVNALAALHDRPVVVFGHSLGALLGFALASREPRIRMLVASGAAGPHVPMRTTYADLPRAELVDELAKMGGTPPEVLADDELLDLYWPMLRADFRLAERLRMRRGAEVTCPITTIAASDDDGVTLDEARQWKDHTTGAFRFVETDGGHFFVSSRRDEVIAEVVRALDEVR